jgi:hypothetical protein
MDKLQKKIINQVYEYETKNIIREVIFKVGGLILFSVVAFIFGFITFQVLQEQNTFDIFQIFTQDFDVIKENLASVLETLSYELPKFDIVVFVVSLVAVIILIYLLLKNLTTIKRKFRAIIKYKGEKKI